MHEATIAQSILNLAQRRLRQTPHAEAVSKIRVLIGEFRNVEIESLRFAFDCLKDLCDACAECTLETERAKARARCRINNHLYHPEADSRFLCTICGAGIGYRYC